MNLFVLDTDFEKCAQFHVDKHVVKMPTEIAQMLSTAVRLSGIEAGYKITHKNHPCTLWVRESLSNWLWARSLLFHLNKEYRYRYEKDVNHKAYDVGMHLPYPDIEDIGLTPFALAMPDCYKLEDAVMSYRSYYNGEKTSLFSWKKREQPYWVDGEIENNE